MLKPLLYFRLKELGHGDFQVFLAKIAWEQRGKYQVNFPTENKL